jgi:hypothetical protein
MEGRSPLVVQRVEGNQVWFADKVCTLLQYATMAARSLQLGAVFHRPNPMPQEQPEPPAITGSANTHARLAPSASKQWSVCTGSIAYIEANAHRIPEDTGSSYADEGTQAHEHAANILLGKCTLEDIPEDFRDPVGRYVAYCRSLVPDGVAPQVEAQVPLFYQPDETGTVDFAVITDERVSVADLKYGAGVLVESAENTQLAIYAYSLIDLVSDAYDFTDATVIDIRVFQPRHREAHTAESWVLTLAELREFCKGIEYAAIQARVGVERVRSKLPCGERDIAAKEILEAAPGLKFVPQHGDDGSCRWCKAKGICEVRLAAATEELAVGFTSGTDLIALMPDLDKEEKKLPVEERVAARFEKMGVPAEALTDDYFVRMFAAKKWIESCLDDVAEMMEARLLAGGHIPGVKLVLGRAGNRDWVNEEAADKFLRNQKLKEAERYEFKLKSPAKMEAALKDKLASTTRTKNLFESLITRSEPKKVLALESDKREAVTATIGLMPELGDEIDIDAYEV